MPFLTTSAFLPKTKNPILEALGKKFAEIKAKAQPIIQKTKEILGKVFPSTPEFGLTTATVLKGSGVAPSVQTISLKPPTEISHKLSTGTTSKSLVGTTSKSLTLPPATSTGITSTGMTSAERQKEIERIEKEIARIQGKIATQQALLRELQSRGLTSTKELPPEVQAKYGLTPTLPPISSERKVPLTSDLEKIQDIITQAYEPTRKLLESQLVRIRKETEEQRKLLEEKHLQEQKDLIGMYAERGFGRESGITQAGLEELRKRQARELAELETARAEAEAGVLGEIAKLGMRAPTETREWLGILKPEIRETGGGLYMISPTGEVTTLISPSIKPEIKEVGGGLYMISPTGEVTTLVPPPAPEDKITRVVQSATGEWVGITSRGQAIPTGVIGTPPTAKVSATEKMVQNLGKTALNALQDVKDYLQINPDWTEWNSMRVRAIALPAKVGTDTRLAWTRFQRAVVNMAYMVSGKQMGFKEATLLFPMYIPTLGDITLDPTGNVVIEKLKRLESDLTTLMENPATSLWVQEQMTTGMTSVPGTTEIINPDDYEVVP